MQLIRRLKNARLKNAQLQNKAHLDRLKGYGRTLMRLGTVTTWMGSWCGRSITTGTAKMPGDGCTPIS